MPTKIVTPIKMIFKNFFKIKHEFCIYDKTKTTEVDTMAEQEMLLDTDTIKVAVVSEKWAKEKVIKHYTPMIDELVVDEDMKQHLILKLLEELPTFSMG